MGKEAQNDIVGQNDIAPTDETVLSVTVFSARQHWLCLARHMLSHVRLSVRQTGVTQVRYHQES